MHKPGMASAEPAYPWGEVFVFFSNNLGCLGSLFVSALGTLILLVLLDVI